MNKGKINQNSVRDFYNHIPEIWPEYDLWHQYSNKTIKDFLYKHMFLKDCYTLNAGSAGNTYGLPYKMHHVDICDEKISNLPNSTVASIEDLPFHSDSFGGIICVGSVINYCDAVSVISEFARVAKTSAKLILEFESSSGFEYRKQASYNKDATIVTVDFLGQPHTQWLYSENYLKEILSDNNWKIEVSYRFHILSSLILSITKNESYSSQFAKFDNKLQHFPYINRHSNNIVFLCEKL